MQIGRAWERAMAGIRSRFELAAASFITTGGLLAMGLVVYASWISFLSYFRYSGRDPDGCGCPTFDILEILLFVYVNLFPYRIVRLFVTSWRATAKSRRSAADRT
jgi:hypothetical protein